MRGPARLLIAGAALLAASHVAHADEGRFALDARTVPVDALVCVCAERAAAPEILHIDGKEAPPPSLWPKAAGGDAPHTIHLALAWPARGPLRLFAEIPARGRTRDLPTWGQQGTLGPGDYVLTATGFEAETLHVRTPNPAEDRSRALIARARLRAEAGDSTLAARLLEQVADRKSDPYAEAAWLALGDLLPYSRYRERPESWLVEWIARRHSACVVGEGIRVWLAHHDDSAGRLALARVVARYPETRANREARALLTPGVPMAP
jgi:hypothetical protein